MKHIRHELDLSGADLTMLLVEHLPKGTLPIEGCIVEATVPGPTRFCFSHKVEKTVIRLRWYTAIPEKRKDPTYAQLNEEERGYINPEEEKEEEAILREKADFHSSRDNLPF